MTRCVEFYDYWDEHPDFCGKSPSTIANINSYAKILNELKALGIEKSFTIVNFPEGNARSIFPLHDPIRSQVLKNVAAWLTLNKKPSQADVKAWISLDTAKRPECKEPEPCKLKPVKCSCEYYDAILPGCIRTFPRLCQLSIEQRKQKGCNLEGMQPPEPKQTIAPSPPITPATVATIAHAPVSQVKPIETFTPVHPIARTDPLDKANGVVKMQKSTDYETLAKEGDMYPITKRTAQTINQMVEYGISPDNLDAHALIEKDGYDHYLEQIEVFLQKEEDSP